MYSGITPPLILVSLWGGMRGKRWWGRWGWINDESEVEEKREVVKGFGRQLFGMRDVWGMEKMWGEETKLRISLHRGTRGESRQDRTRTERIFKMNIPGCVSQAAAAASIPESGIPFQTGKLWVWEGSVKQITQITATVREHNLKKKMPCSLWSGQTHGKNMFALSCCPVVSTRTHTYTHTHRVAYYKPTSHIEGFIHQILSSLLIYVSFI